MMSFVDAHRGDYGVEPICRELPMAPSVFCAHRHRWAHPETAPRRVRQDALLKPQIQAAHRESHDLYGVRKVWHSLRQKGTQVGRQRVARLMRELQLQRVNRGRKRVVTTVPEPLAERSRSLVQRHFSAPSPDC